MAQHNGQLEGMIRRILSKNGELSTDNINERLPPKRRQSVCRVGRICKGMPDVEKVGRIRVDKRSYGGGYYSMMTWRLKE